MQMHDRVSLSMASVEAHEQLAPCLSVPHRATPPRYPPSYSTLFHSTYSTPFYFIPDMSPLRSTPFHDLGHAPFELELCDLTSPSTSVKVCIYQPLM